MSRKPRNLTQQNYRNQTICKVLKYKPSKNRFILVTLHNGQLLMGSRVCWLRNPRLISILLSAFGSAFVSVSCSSFKPTIYISEKYSLIPIENNLGNFSAFLIYRILLSVSPLRKKIFLIIFCPPLGNSSIAKILWINK